jgi:hypothetical protein
MSTRSGLGSLADLAKILEEASDPESAHREDRREAKPKPTTTRKSASSKQVRVLDPKRRVWYEKRLKEQTEAASASACVTLEPRPVVAAKHPLLPGITKAVARGLGGNLLESLANAAKSAKDKAEGGKTRTEAWRRKPGDPIF